MPVYEYYCQSCDLKFELLRRLDSANDDGVCPHCQSKAQRVLSVFASFSKGSDGSSSPIAGGSSCTGCTSTSCSSCQ